MFFYSDVLGESNKWNFFTFIFTLTNKDTDEKEFENMHRILLDGRYDTTSLLVETDHCGDL